MAVVPVNDVGRNETRRHRPTVPIHAVSLEVKIR